VLTLPPKPWLLGALGGDAGQSPIKRSPLVCAHYESLRPARPQFGQGIAGATLGHGAQLPCNAVSRVIVEPHYLAPFASLTYAVIHTRWRLLAALSLLLNTSVYEVTSTRVRYV
jgi:hypothetical protein